MLCNVSNVINMVTPLVGVWIEIERGLQIRTSDGVTPLVGVWIEIGAGNPG